MCGFPYHVTEMYVNKLLEQSAVVVLEDGEEPKYIASEQEVNGDEGNDEAAELDEEVEEVVPQEEKPSEKGIKDRKRKSKPQMSLFDFMEDDELTKKEKLITQTLQRGSGVENGKQRIFDKYQQNPTKQEFASFLSKEYGIERPGYRRPHARRKRNQSHIKRQNDFCIHEMAGSSRTNCRPDRRQQLF